MKAIFFDLNGVFVISPLLSDRFRDDYNVSPDKFIPALKEILAKVRMPDAERIYSYWNPYLEKWGVDISEQAFLNYWFIAEKEDAQLVELARELKERDVRLFILSNNFKERAKYYKQNFPFLEELFEKVYYSWKTGFVKPDERVYKLVLEENNLQPENCLYIDNDNKNIDAANSLGIISYYYDTEKHDLEALKVFLDSNL